MKKWSLRVLLVAPTAPAPARNGLAMRAGVTAEALHAAHELTVAVVRSPYGEAPLDWARAHARSVVELVGGDDARSTFSWVSTERGRRVAGAPLPSLVRFWPPAVGDAVVDAVGDAFDVVVVMGTYLAGVALPFLERGIPAVLDAFDDDARTSASLARLDDSYAEEVPRFEAFQAEVFGWFGRVLFASPTDAVPPFVHLPNAVRIPPAPPPHARSSGDEPLRLLFVGNPSYLPNRDAVDRLRERIVPAVAARGVRVELLHPAPEDDVHACYERADIAVVPLRAAGGSRIKILEAFAAGCPVVSTPTGASGLEVEPGVHLLVTPDDDDVEAFADAVVTLARDEARRRALSAAARAWVIANHDHRVVGRQLVTIVEEVARGVASGV